MTAQPTPGAVTGATAVPDPVQSAINNLEAATSAAPELQKVPGATLDVASAGGNVPNSAQAVAAAGNRQPRAAAAASANASMEGGIGGFFSHLGHDVAHVGEDFGSAALKAVNVPLNAVQHEWRYLHDVEARHGLLAALGEGLVIVGAAAAGAVLTGGVADVAEAGLLAGGAEAAGEVGAEGLAAGAGEAAAGGAAEAAGGSAARGALSQVMRVGGKVLNMSAPARVVIPGEAAGLGMAQVLYRDSWNRTANAQYRDPHTGQLVNFGNDVAGWFGIKSGALRTALSGTSNAIFDLASDPVASLGKVAAAGKSAEGLQLLGKTYSRAWSAENIQRLSSDTTMQAKAFQKWLGWAADHNTGDVMAFDRRLAPIAPEIGNATTPDEVAQVLVDHVASTEVTHPTVLPSMSLTKQGMTTVRDALNNAQTDYLHPLTGGGLRHPVQALKTLPGRVGRLTTRVPGTAYDAEKMRFVAHELDPVSLKGIEAWRDGLEMGVGRNVANKIVHIYTNADVATRQIIYRNASLMQLLGHAGLDFRAPAKLDEEGWFKGTLKDALDEVNDPKFREHIQRKIDSLLAPMNPNAGGVYDAHIEGPSRPLYDPETGQDVHAAIRRDQVGPVPILGYHDVHRMGQMLAGARMFTGKLDDFAMSHITDPLFKRWILMSGGYAVHISAAEMIPNTLRLGLRNMVTHSYALAMARLGQRVTSYDPEELKGLTGKLYNFLEDHSKAPWAQRAMKVANAGAHAAAGKLAEMAPADAQKMERAQLWLEMTDGHGVTRGWAPHGGLIDSTDDPVGRNSHVLRGTMSQMRWKRGNKFVTYSPPDTEHLRSWRLWLNGQANDPAYNAAAKAMHESYRAGEGNDAAYVAAQRAAHESLLGMDPAERSGYIRSQLKHRDDPPSMTPLESWSHDIAQDLTASTHDGSDVHGPHLGLLDNVASGNLTHRRLLEGVPQDMRPRAVPGREIVPSGSSFFQRLSSVGYQRVLNPIVNVLSREPTAFTEFDKRMALYEPLAKAGILSPEEVAIKAASESTLDGIRYIHNVQDRTQLDQIVRNWVPFWFAQEQAYRRMGRLLAEDPGAFRRYMLAIQSTHDIVSQAQDSQGNRYFAFPGSGFLDHLTVSAFGMIGMPTASLNPTGFGGTLSAANVVFPFANGVRPDISPVVTLSSQAIYNMFEEFGRSYTEFQPITNTVSGALFDAVGSSDMSQSVWQQLIPNTTMYRAIETATASDTSFTSAMLMTIQNLSYQQNMAMSQWVKEGQKGARPNIIPSPDASPQELQDFLSRVKNQTRIVYGMRALLGAVSPVSADVMVSDFGLNAKLQADITKAGSVSAGFQKFLADNPNATPYVVSKSTTATGASLPDTQQALDWITQNVTNNKALAHYQAGAMWLMPRPTSAPYSAQAYLEEIANGLRQRRSPLEFLQAIYAENGDQMYYSALAQHEAALKSGTDSTQEYAKWASYMQYLQKTQPIWWQQFNNGQRATNAVASINDLGAIFSAGIAPKGPQTDAVQALYNQFVSVEQEYMQAGQQTNYSTTQKQIRDQWIQQCDALAQANPNLQSIISSVFRDALTTYNQT